MHVKTD